MSKLTTGLFSALAVSALSLTASAQTYTTSVVASGFSRPVYLTSPPNDPTNRLFVLEQHTGRVEIISGGSILPTPFIDLSGIATGNEQGLLGMAFHPDYATNGEFFLHYTISGGASRVAKYTVSASNANVANPAADVILAYNQPFSNHNAGMIEFGPDGYLYVATGDGGNGGDPGDRAQNPTNILGKMLRIDVDGDDFPSDSLRDYAIPPGQPFFATGAIPELWMIGLRNPWRFSFDSLTGEMWIGDVGQNAREEVNLAPADSMGMPIGGQNWGWRCKEGFSCFTGSSFCNCATPALVDPVFDYPWSPGVSVTGGYAYRGPLTCIQGVYFSSDAGTGIIRVAEKDGMGGVTVTNATADFNIPGAEAVTSFGEDALGNLYIVDFIGGEIHLIELDEACPVPGISECNGDGGNQMGCSDCPCMNNAPPGTIGGCLNSAGTSSRLIDSGAPSVTNDSLRFEMDGVPAMATCVLLSGSAVAPANMANPCFGLNSGTQAFDRDGLRCAVQNTVRHGNRMSDINGTVGMTNNGWGPPNGPTGGLLGQVGLMAGQSRTFQVTHRDDPMGGCGRGLNTSQAVTHTAIP